jgi:hypothetical protein
MEFLFLLPQDARVSGVKIDRKIDAEISIKDWGF